MTYLERIESALNNPMYSYAHNNVSVVVERILKNEKLSEEERSEILNYQLQLKECDYYNMWTHEIDYNKARKFTRVGSELYYYLEEIGYD